LALGVGLICAGTVAAQSGGGQTDLDVADLLGNGTTADPYVLTNASELQAMEDDLGANYTLVADIDATGTATWNNGSKFDPVATTPFFGGTGFSGTFDGAGHTISGLTIERASQYAGLFGGVAADGDLNVLDVQSLFDNLDSPAVRQHPRAFAFAGINLDEMTILDVQALFNDLPPT
jgi:hypothetical protein